PPLGAGLCVGAAGVGRVPELSAHPRGGVPRGPSDRLLYTSIYALQSPGGRRAVPARQAGSGMSVAAAALAGMALDAWLGEVRRWHPLVGFGRLAHAIEQRLNGPQGRGGRIAGVLGWTLAVLPLVALAALCSHLLGVWWDVLMLYFAVGLRSLAEHARPIAQALRLGQLEEARRRVSYLVSRDTTRLDEAGVARA